MSKTRILFVTIGQSPRPGLLAALTESLAKPAKITEIGLLDGLSGSEIEELQAKPDEPAVTARLAGGV